MYKKIKYYFVEILKSLFSDYYKEHKLGYCGKNVIYKSRIYNPRIFLYDNTNIYDGFRFISYTGSFIMKKNSGSAQGLTVITNNHYRVVGEYIKETIKKRSEDVDQDVIVEEDVWIGANVTLMPGITVGRGVNIGAGSVVRFNVPPYSVVLGNPAKIVAFSFTPDEMKEHEEKLYAPEERIDIARYKTLYDRFYIDNISDIRKFVDKKA